MAIELKTPRKRAVKKSSRKKSETPDVVVEEVAVAAPSKRKSAAIPVPVFQAADTTVKPARKSAAKKVEAPVAEAEAATESDSDAESRSSRNRRRRRGGRGRRKPGQDASTDTNEDSTQEEGDEESADGTTPHHHRFRPSIRVGFAWFARYHSHRCAFGDVARFVADQSNRSCRSLRSEVTEHGHQHA